MDTITAFHTAARRYCIDRYAELHKVGKEISTRFQAIDAILAEIERFTPSDFEDVQEAKNLMAHAGQVAENGFITSLHKTPKFKKIIQMERDSFSEFIQSLTENDLANIQPLPYQRVLAQKESEAIWRALQNRWQCEQKNRYWYPLTDVQVEGILAFDAKKFVHSSAWELLPNLLAARNENRVYELPEVGEEREIEVIKGENLFFPGSEVFWTTKDFEAIVYISHENSLTLGGWLLEDFKQSYENWSLLLYSGVDF